MKKRLIAVGCAIFWLVLWQIGAMLLNQEILLVSPVDAVAKLLTLIPTEDFIKSVGFSSGRIMLGFALGLVCGTCLSFAAGKIKLVKTLFSPLISAVKAVPVASITVLALIWVSSRNLSVLVTFLITLPAVYSNMLEGIESLDPKLAEMAKIFRIPAWRRFTGVYISQLLPYFRAAVRMAIGLSWKSGAAAEIIGIPSGSIGEKLYEAKIYLETADLFAWTIAVILLSFISERLFLLAVDAAVKLAANGGRVARAVKPSADYPPVGVSCAGVTVSYGENTVLDGFSCDFPSGWLTAVAGASGCGKTTLLSAVAGILRPSGGEIKYTVSEPKISMVFQENRLCENLTAAANIRLVTGKALSDAEISEALAKVGLAGCENKPARELSGGMKRRVALLRALLSDYGLILLDEPFKGLDAQTKAQVLDYCRQSLKGKTAILVTHDSAEPEALCAREVVNL